jgi:hypothetical protein
VGWKTLVLAAAVFAAGWTANGWRYGEKIAKMREAAADTRADVAQTALSDLAAAAKNVREAADAHQGDSTLLAGKIEDLRRGMRNAIVLPADCRPDSVRMRDIRAAVDAANEAATR